MDSEWGVTLSGRIGKVVASHAAVARSSSAEVALIYNARGAQGMLPRPPTVQAWVYYAVRLINSFIFFSN